MPDPFEPEFRWWVADCSLPRLEWVLARRLADGTVELSSAAGPLEWCASEEEARHLLMEDEYVPFDEAAEELREHGLAAGTSPPPLESWLARFQPATCPLCGARWSDGHARASCPCCDGHALLRPCPVCGGACGAVWSRAVIDSIDSGRAHWLGACRLADSEE